MTSDLKQIDKENKLFELEKKIEKADDNIKTKLGVYEGLKVAIKKEEQHHHDKIKILDEQIATLHANQKRLENDIKTRARYLKDQEDQISRAVENGNDHILNLNHEASELDKLKTQTEILLKDAKDQFVVYQNAVSKKEDELEELEKKYNDANELYQKTLEGLKKRIFDANDEYKEIISKSREIVTRLKAKEEELYNRV